MIHSDKCLHSLEIVPPDQVNKILFHGQGKEVLLFVRLERAIGPKGVNPSDCLCLTDHLGLLGVSDSSRWVCAGNTQSSSGCS